MPGDGRSKGGSSKGGSSSQNLSEKKMRKMETKALEEKLIVLRGALFEADGSDKNVCATLGPFLKYDRNGLNVAVEFKTRLGDADRKWAFGLVKKTMEAKYDAAGYGWDDADKDKELSEDGGRFLLFRDAASGDLLGFAHFRFTVQGDVVERMLGEPVVMVHDLQVVEAARRKGLARHAMAILEMVARRTAMRRVSLPVMAGDDATRAFVASLKKGAFAEDASLAALVDFDADLEGFDVFSLPLAAPVRKIAAPALAAAADAEEADDAADLDQTRELLRSSVASAFAAKHGREPSDEEREAIYAVIDGKLAERAGDAAAPAMTGKEQRAKKRADRDRAAAAFEKAEGRAPTDAELADLLALVAGAAAAPPTPPKKTALADEVSPTSVAKDATAC